jgi:hypothetical protein
LNHSPNLSRLSPFTTRKPLGGTKGFPDTGY